MADADEFATMAEYANRLIVKTGQQIMAGDVAVKPYQLDGKSGCDYCPYHTVCGFDVRIPGYEFHKMEKMDKPEDILSAMKKTREDEEA